jgi:hypothetical protein
LIDDVNDTDAPLLRRKLRRAADRSSTGCLDLWQALGVTQQTQDLISNDKRWNEYYKKSTLPNPANALTAIETKLPMKTVPAHPRYPSGSQMLLDGGGQGIQGALPLDASI